MVSHLLHLERETLIKLDNDSRRNMEIFNSNFLKAGVSSISK